MRRTPLQMHTTKIKTVNILWSKLFHAFAKYYRHKISMYTVYVLNVPVSIGCSIERQANWLARACENGLNHNILDNPLKRIWELS